MENATKALLIAAGVLVVIVLIALGVSLLNSGSEVTGQTRAVAQSSAVQIFNAQFTSYLGENQTAKSVRELTEVIKTSNISNPEQVNEGISISRKKLIDGHLYTVTAEYDEMGMINRIKVKDNSTDEFVDYPAS